MQITLDKQLVRQCCDECNIEFNFLRGSVYENGEPAGLYMISLHGHSSRGHLATLAISLFLEKVSEMSVPIAAAIQVVAVPHQFEFSLVEWLDSPWHGHDYLGEMLAPYEVRNHDFRTKFFRVAGHLVNDLEEVRQYFDGSQTAC